MSQQTKTNDNDNNKIVKGNNSSKESFTFSSSYSC